MSDKERVFTVRVDRELAEALDAMRTRYGTPYSEQVRRALVLWLTQQGMAIGHPKPAQDAGDFIL